MSESTLVGTLWKHKHEPRPIAKIVGESWSVGGRPGRILTIVYGPDYCPSILPSTSFMTDFMREYELFMEGQK